MKQNRHQKIAELIAEYEIETQEELADRTELSKGFISQVERDLTSPSIATLMDILQALGTDLKDFFYEEPEEQIVFHEGDYFEKEDDEYKNRMEWIIPNAQKNIMEPVRLTLAPGGNTYPDNPHEGEEFGYVLEGRIAVVIAGRSKTVKKGRKLLLLCGQGALHRQQGEGKGQIFVGLHPAQFLRKDRPARSPLSYI